ncbi:unnamed protein product [Adineta ricciae]|uniref:Uncharacterized protein n=1 Tax=Adineta ricciae TaxID=249248 RepID=A0A815DFH2_ADIRI|nr:unnamed protein product [Adineta ricciae]CAF1446265.1 unnamed protein product [Adineta ricciae]
MERYDGVDRNNTFFRTSSSSIIPNANTDPPLDKFTQCLLHAQQTFANLSLPWFLAFGTALMYYRSNNFISDDIDIGIYIDDLQKRNITDETFISTIFAHGFKLYTKYGNRTHGQGWTLLCPKTKLHFGIFVFYHSNALENETFSWWTASYNGLCNQMKYRKCRWWFSDFQPLALQMYGKSFQIAPKQFLVEQYGPKWMTPQRYGYFESLEFLPNLIIER